MSDQLPWVLVVLGATAVGKTELSIELAERINGEIISADSRLFYRCMDIGTAKPTEQEMARVPHHLIDVSDPDENWSVAKYQKHVRELICEINSRGKIPICVGGTGQYISAITQGWVIPKVKENPGLREALNNWGKEMGAVELHNKLTSIDPKAAAKIEPNNLRRTVRAFEVMLSTGLLFSSQRRKERLPYRVFMIGLQRERDEIFERVDVRVDQMMRNGFLQEVKFLLTKGYKPELRAFSAIGYSQLISHLSGDMSLDEAIYDIKRKTKQFVRRQNTWFKPNDPEINWYQMHDNSLEEIISDLKSLRII